jgi:hypothetical protein
MGEIYIGIFTLALAVVLLSFEIRGLRERITTLENRRWEDAR